MKVAILIIALQVAEFHGVNAGSPGQRRDAQPWAAAIQVDERPGFARRHAGDKKRNAQVEQSDQAQVEEFASVVKAELIQVNNIAPFSPYITGDISNQGFTAAGVGKQPAVKLPPGAEAGQLPGSSLLSLLEGGLGVQGQSLTLLSAGGQSQSTQKSRSQASKSAWGTPMSPLGTGQTMSRSLNGLNASIATGTQSSRSTMQAGTRSLASIAASQALPIPTATLQPAGLQPPMVTGSNMTLEAISSLQPLAAPSAPLPPPGAVPAVTSFSAPGGVQPSVLPPGSTVTVSKNGQGSTVSTLSAMNSVPLAGGVSAQAAGVPSTVTMSPVGQGTSTNAAGQAAGACTCTCPCPAGSFPMPVAQAPAPAPQPVQAQSQAQAPAPPTTLTTIASPTPPPAAAASLQFTTSTSSSSAPTALAAMAPAPSPSPQPIAASFSSSQGSAGDITLMGGSVLPLQSSVTVPLLGKWFHIGPVQFDESMWT